MKAPGSVSEAEMDALDTQRRQVVEMAREHGALDEAEQALGGTPFALSQAQPDPGCQDHRMHRSPPCSSASGAAEF